MSYIGLHDLRNQSLTILGQQQIGSIIGFDPKNQRLYCFLTKNSHSMTAGAAPGWLPLDKPQYHLLSLPGYYDVGSEKGKKLSTGLHVEPWQLVSHDEFLVLDDAAAVSSDGRSLVLYEERFSRNGEDFRTSAARLTIWDVSGSPQLHRTIEADSKSNPKFFKLLKGPKKLSFTSDNRSLIMWSDEGVVVQFLVGSK